MSHPTMSDPVVGPKEERLPRRLGVWSAAAVLIGSTIGSGIFRVPSTVAADVGGVGAMLLVWVVGAVVALFGALTLAELATLFPRSGGIYVFLREAYGPLPAFLFGWTELLVIRPAALGAISMIFAQYLGAFFPLSDAGVRLIAAVAIAALAAANIRSIVWGAAVQNVSTAAKVVALVAVMWAYDGWADLTFVAGEVRDPERAMPRALLWGVGVVILVYLTVNLAYLYVLPVGAMAESRLVAADAATQIFGRAGATVISGLVVLSTFGALNGSTMTGPRILYAMADDGLFFRAIAAVHPRYGTPYAAIGLAALLGIAYVSIRTFEQLAGAFILGIWPFYALAVGAVFLLRRRRPDLARPYRTAGYPVVPAVFLLASVAMLANALIEEPVDTGISFGVIVAGIPVYYVWRGLGRRAGRG